MYVLREIKISFVWTIYKDVQTFVKKNLDSPLAFQNKKLIIENIT